MPSSLRLRKKIFFPKVFSHLAENIIGPLGRPDMGDQDIKLVVKPEEYFHEKVSAAIKRLNLEINEDIEFYLVHLLCDFIDPTKISTALGENEDVMDLPLALMLKKATEAPPNGKMRIFKTLGDTSLYFSGFFQDYFNRKSFDIGYYITLGTIGYQNVAALMRDHHREDHFYELYQELADCFERLVDVVAEVSTETNPMTASNVLSVYDRWTKCNSQRLYRLLSKYGITPIPPTSSLKKAQ